MTLTKPHRRHRMGLFGLGLATTALCAAAALSGLGGTTDAEAVKPATLSADPNPAACCRTAFVHFQGSGYQPDSVVFITVLGADYDDPATLIFTDADGNLMPETGGICTHDPGLYTIVASQYPGRGRSPNQMERVRIGLEVTAPGAPTVC